MKRQLFRLSVSILVLPLLAFLTGCSKSDNSKPDEIVIDGNVTEIVFTPDGGIVQTLKFTASAPWTMTVDKIGFARITPPQGNAGSAAVAIQLLDPDSKVDREGIATITAGSAVVKIRIVQIVPVRPEEIEITAPQKRIPLGKSVLLTLAVKPENAVVETIEWSSSVPSVLSIDATGKVAALTVGTSVVTAKTGGLTAQCTIEVTEAFTTDGSGRTYTFKELSELESGVEVENGAYVVTANIIIAESDKLKLGDGEQIKIKDGVEIRVMGILDFTPASPAAVMAFDASAVPSPIYFTGDNASGTIRNVTFTGVAVRYFSGNPVTIESCKFTGISSKYPAINLGSGSLMTVSKCEFVENESSAIAGGSNMVTPLVFKDNYLYKNSKNVTNRPQINVTVAGDGKVEIKGNTIVGPGQITTNGGIAVANLLGIAGTNQVLIEGNKVSDCRYGITTNGTMDVRIINNVLENNKWDSNPMNGGSGVSVYNSKGGQKVYMSGNTIKGHLWGVTLIGTPASGTGPVVNMGNLTQGADYNPGGNVFKDNGNGGVLYDLYNNSPMTVYAQGNTWNVNPQTEANIETVIFHKPDQASLGLVIFMPAAQ